MIKKINLSQQEKEEIYNKYKGGVSMRKLEEQYPYSFTFIQKLVKSFEFEDKLNKNYPQKDGYYIVAICKKTNIIIDDYKNTSGAITNHLKSTYPDIIIESNYKRKSKEYETGKFWYDEYFLFDYVLIKKLKKCEYCDWTTTDVNNKSGAYEKHLKTIHNISIENHIKQYPSDESYFKKYEDTSEMGLVECKVCGKKLKIINEKHLNKHGLTVREYKIKYEHINIVSDDFLDKMKLQYEKCLKIQPFTRISKLEKKIIENVNDVAFESSNRKILNGMEIDLYVEDKKIGFEINGCLFHSEIFGKKDRNYHLNKTMKCLEKNIYLYHIFEDELYYKSEIVYSKINHILNKNKTIKKIHGRKCEIGVNLNNNIKKTFLNNNHIQGNDKSNINIYATFEDEVVAVMCFNNNRNMNKAKNHNKNIYELTRFCVKRDYIVNGIASKMLKFFIRNFQPDKIISFADIRWTPNPSNNLYTKLGFQFDKQIKPDYTYYNPKIDPYHRFHKFNYGKNKLKNKFPLSYHENKSEWEIMQEEGFDRIWDCGKYRYVLSIKKGEN